MKKLCLVLVLILLFSTVCGFAEGIDFSSMSDEEVESIMDKAKAELLDRGVIRSGVLLKSAYVAGEDIACGTYIGSRPEGELALSFIVLEDMETYENYDMWDLSKDYGTLENVFDDEKCRIVLNEGNVLYIINGSMYLEEERLGLLAP